jgi:hypothetical protein
MNSYDLMNITSRMQHYDDVARKMASEHLRSMGIRQTNKPKAAWTLRKGELFLHLAHKHA